MLRPSYHQNMLESWGSRRKNAQLVVVVVGDRKSKVSRSNVDGHVQNSCDSGRAFSIWPKFQPVTYIRAPAGEKRHYDTCNQCSPRSDCESSPPGLHCSSVCRQRRITDTMWIMIRHYSYYLSVQCMYLNIANDVRLIFSVGGSYWSRPAMWFCTLRHPRNFMKCTLKTTIFP